MKPKAKPSRARYLRKPKRHDIEGGDPDEDEREDPINGAGEEDTSENGKP